MSTISVDLIDSAIDSTWSEIRVRPAYSGRFMYGRTCFGIVVEDERDLVKFFSGLKDAIEATDEDSELLDSLQDNMSTDDMGRRMIAYFPGYSLDGPSTYEYN